jgi:hypothetical protein
MWIFKDHENHPFLNEISDNCPWHRPFNNYPVAKTRML